MTGSFFSWPRFAVASCLIVAVTFLAACESSPDSATMQEGNGEAATLPPIPNVLPPQPPPLDPAKQDRSRLPVSLPASPAAPAESVVLTPPPLPFVTRVALLLPLSGANGGLGAEMLNAAQMALFDFADERFELVLHDTKGTPAGAADAVTLAIGDGATLILGPLFSGSVKAVTPTARAAGIKVIAFSSDRSVAGDGVYTMGFLPGADVERVVRFAHSRGIARFAAFAPDNPFGRTVVEALRDVAANAGATVNRVRFYDPGADDFTAVVKQLANYDARRHALLAQRKALQSRDDEIAKRALGRLENLQTLGDLPFDALLVADGGKRLQAIAALLPFYDVDPAKIRMLGTGQWDYAGIGAEPALVGGWYAAPLPAARADFNAQYRKVYGRTPPRLVTLAYDATALAAVLARAEGGADFSDEALTTPSGFYGRDGIFRFLPDGLAQRGLAVLEVRARDATVVDKPPEAFSAAMY
jgi:branched-chain amino acid transport system substrate-binding protein